jgi:hypothetical protein
VDSELHRKHRMVLERSRESSTTQIDSENSLSPLRHFTEHLVGVFEKLSPENNLDHESSSLSIRWLNSTPVIQPATNHTTRATITAENQTLFKESKVTVKLEAGHSTGALEQNQDAGCCSRAHGCRLCRFG